MVVLVYSRTGAKRFLSHIDVLRDFARIVRRADIPVGYSAGFNPHALLFFSPPTPVGIASVAEYAALDTELSPEETLARFNAAVSEDMRASAAYRVLKNPNLAGRIAAADHVFPFPADAYDISRGLELSYVKKGTPVREDVSDRIFAAENRDGKLLLRLASGNVTLRADRVFDALKSALGTDALVTDALVTDVVKTEQYVREGGVLIPAREALEKRN